MSSGMKWEREEEDANEQLTGKNGRTDGRTMEWP